MWPCRWILLPVSIVISLTYLILKKIPPGTPLWGEDGLNRLNLAASTKWAMKLNTWFTKEDRISTQPPLGDSPGLLPAVLTYDAPSLMEWEKKVLPKLFAEEQKDAKTVHLIVTHGKTLTAYLKKCGLTV